MRPRYRNDWVTDLNARHPLEHEVAAAIAANRYLGLVADHTSELDQLDYTVTLNNSDQAVAVELKAKWQPYQASWGRHRPEVPTGDLFILDELSLRRLIGAGPLSHLMIYDHPNSRWVLFGVLELALAPKARLSRPLRGRWATTKGKLIIDLGDGHPAGVTPTEAVATLVQRIGVTARRWNQIEAWPLPHRQAS